MAYNIRLATLEDRSRIQQLIVESARGLSREHYSDAQIEAAIATTFGVDTSLIEDGTYFVAEDEGRAGGLWRLEQASHALRRRSVHVERC